MSRGVATGWLGDAGRVPAGRRGLVFVALAVTAIACGVGLETAAGKPAVLIAILAMPIACWGVARAVSAVGPLGTWVGVSALGVLAGEMAAIPLAGQNAHLLWADVAIVGGLAIAVAASRFALRVPRAPVLDALWPFLGWCTLTLPLAGDPATAIAELKEWCAAAIVAGAALAWATDAPRARRLLALVGAVGALAGVHMVLAALTSPVGAPVAVQLKLVDLPWGRTNYIAGLLIVAIPVLIGLIGTAGRARDRLAGSIALVAAIAGLCVSTSKGAVLALVVSLVLAFGTARRQSRLPLVLMVALLAAGTVLYVAGPFQQALLWRMQTSAIDYSVGERVDVYALAWSQFLTHPVFGVGLNNFSVAAHVLRGVDTVPHNLELGMLAELGVPGLALCLAWVATMGAVAWHTRRRARTAGERTLALGLWAAFLGFFLHNQVESTLYGQQYKMVLVLTAVATWRLGRAWSEAAGNDEAGLAKRPGPV